MNPEDIGTLFVVDWSFVLVLVGLAAITVLLAVRRMRAKRRAQREARRARRREYKAWLRNSGVQPLAQDQQDDAASR